MANKDMFLWWGSGSVPCWKVMLVLAQKGMWVGLPNKQISFSEKGHKQEDIMRLNSRGQVPTFKDGETVVNESDAICLYLEEKFSNQGAKLLPPDTVDRSRVYQRMFETRNVANNVTIPIIKHKQRTKREDWDASLLKEMQDRAREELVLWDKLLAQSNFLCGETFTMADAFFFPFLAFLVRSGVSFKSRPGLKRYYESLVELPSVQSTWPPHWRETAGNSLLEGI